MSLKMSPDVVFLDGPVTTLDSNRPQATNLKDAEGHDPDPNTETIDLAGRRVIPGQNDSHLQLIRGGLNYKLEGINQQRSTRMKTATQDNTPKPALIIRFHLTDGSIHSFLQTDDAAARKLLEGLDPAKLFTRPRIVIGGEHSKSVFVSAEIARVDFLQDRFQCWEFPSGYSDIVELSEEEFRKHAHLDRPALMAKRERPTPAGDLLVSFVKLQLKGGHPVFVMVEISVKLPAESQSFMQFMLSKASIHMRLRDGGIGTLNLANLVGYTVYPGLAQIPADAWLAEPHPYPID